MRAPANGGGPEAEYLTRCLAADAAGIEEAARLLRAGQAVAIPTETVYGLAANAFNSAALQKIFTAKGRPQDNPLIVHIASLSMLPLAAASVPESARRLARAFWPGPLTLVLPRSARLAAEVGPGLSTVGVRLPAHAAARALIKAAGFPLAAPSANRSGGPSPTSAAHVAADLAGRIPLVLDGGPCTVGLESTVLSLAGEEPRILRPGFVTAEEIAEVLGRPVGYAAGVEAPLPEDALPESPGLKYRHYAPKARLILAEGPRAAFIAYVRACARGKHGALPPVYVLCCEEDAGEMPAPAVCCGRRGDAASQARGLFAALRQLDARGAKTVYAQIPRGQGIGLAVKNRLLRAAGFQVIQL